MSSVSLHDVELRAFLPVPVFVSRRVVLSVGSAFAAIQQQHAAAVPIQRLCCDIMVVALGRLLHFISFPAASYLLSAASNPSDRPPTL